MMNKIKNILFGAILTGLSHSVLAGTILLTQFDISSTGYGQIKSNLESDGHTVNIVNTTSGGALAAALGSGIYDSLFLWDLTSSLLLNATDTTAVSTFFASHNSIVQDSRSYGYHFQGDNASEQALMRNVANEFDARNGGLWIGTDHAPTWTNNGNAVLAALGFNLITGSHSDAVNDFDPSSVLLNGVVTTDLWGAGASVGDVSLGIQPNGVDMRFHFGHSSSANGAIPYISASFGDYIAPDEDPDTHNPSDPTSVPEPESLALLSLGLLCFFRKRKITS